MLFDDSPVMSLNTETQSVQTPSMELPERLDLVDSDIPMETEFLTKDLKTTRTITNIKKTLHKHLVDKYGKRKARVLDKLLHIHGLEAKNFDFMANINEMIVNQINDVSIDDNSNKNEKTIEGIIQEAIAPAKKAIGYDYLYRKMKELFGQDEAKFLSGEMLDLSLGLSDSTNILKVYCWALDASRLLTEGRPFGQLESGACKKVKSYISSLCETIHQLSSHLAGAIAVGTFFTDIAYLCLYREGIDLRDLRTSMKIRKDLEDEFQQFVHSVNHLSRNAVESPFSNISIFDREKLKNIVEESSLFTVQGLPISYPRNMNDEDIEEYCKEYIIDYIMELQEIFLDFFDKGDPKKNGRPYRFPVTTLNISKHKRGDNWYVSDPDFLRSVCKRDIVRYNIFASEGTRVASCCRLLSDTEMLEYASQSNSFGGGGSTSLGSHRVCTVNFMRIALEAKSKKNFYDILDRRLKSCAKILKAHKELILELENADLQQFISLGWINKHRLFSTFGIMGIYEASHVFKEKFGNGHDVEGEVLTHMNKRVEELSQEYGIIGNIEQIPGESFAVRLANADRMLYGEEKVPYQLYSNQFIPSWEDATIWERLEVDGKYNSLITGGGIAPATIGEKVTSKQAEKIIKYAIKCGCEHFALNGIYSECENGHNSIGDLETCPICSANIVEKMTRVVGFFTPISSWNPVRREWEFPRRTKVDLSDV